MKSLPKNKPSSPSKTLNTTPSLLDTSLWVALAFSKHPTHASAQQVFGEADSAQPIAFCRATQQSFLRLITTPRLHNLYDSPPFSNQQAWALCQQLLALPQVTYLEEPPGLATHWQKYASLPSPSPKVWMDAYLAAFTRAHGITLVTLDKDFKNFPSLRLRLLS